MNDFELRGLQNSGFRIRRCRSQSCVRSDRLDQDCKEEANVSELMDKIELWVKLSAATTSQTVIQ